MVLVELKSRAARRVIDRMWFCPHPYGANHPPDYPYDARNQQDHPGATVCADDIGVLQFQEFAPIFEEELGFVPPFIAGEGGWPFGNAEDARYPRIDDALHARYHAALFQWFRLGRLSNGEGLPDYLFAFCPWILFGPEAEAWYSTSTGTRLQTIEAVRALLKFTRAFGAPTGARSASQPGLKVLGHYVFMGRASPAQWSRLILARRYLTRFNVTFGFSLAEAMRAEDVTILGDQRMVSAEDERRLKSAGCQVERLLGDAEALEIILRDRLRRNAEYG
jgi:hypothetical protein